MICHSTLNLFHIYIGFAMVLFQADLLKKNLSFQV